MNTWKKLFLKKQLKNFSNDLKNINKNYDSLLVRGVDLLKLENDIFKRLKGRKIINEFERLMSPSNIKCKDFCLNINRNLFNQNTKPAYNLID